MVFDKNNIKKQFIKKKKKKKKKTKRERKIGIINTL
jgi:hypothetical protein